MSQKFKSNSLQVFRDHFALQINWLKCAGFWKQDSYSSPVLKRLYELYNGTMMTIILIFSVTLFVDICLNLNDIAVATDDGCVFAGIFVVFFKIIMFQLNRKRIDKLIDQAFQSAEMLCETSVVKVEDILKSHIFREKVLLYVFGIMGYLLSVALIFFVPTKDGELPIRARYPFDTRTSPWHEIAFTIESCAVFGGLTAIVSMDKTLVSLGELVLFQYEILGLNFEKCTGKLIRQKDREDSPRECHPNETRSIDEDAYGLRSKLNSWDFKDVAWRRTTRVRVEGAREYAVRSPGEKFRRNNANFTERFKECIWHQRRLIKIVADINDLFSMCAFAQMISSTSMICLTGFQAIAVGGQNSNVWKSSIYLGASVSQLFYICWIGNEIIYASSAISTSQWLSNWHGESYPTIGKLLAISFVCSKRPQRLKAGAFFTLSMETFVAILRGSYSFFTLLNNIQEGDK